MQEKYSCVICRPRVHVKYRCDGRQDFEGVPRLQVRVVGWQSSSSLVFLDLGRAERLIQTL